MHCDAEKTECARKSLARNMQSNGWLFKSQVVCGVLWALNSGSKGLNESRINESQAMISSSSYLRFSLNIQRNVLTEFHLPLFTINTKLCSEANVQIIVFGVTRSVLLLQKLNMIINNCESWLVP
jgi:hypothetical protein